MGMLLRRHRDRHEASDAPSGDVDLDSATKPKLIEYAKAHEIEVDPKAKKADILESIRAAQSPGSGDDDSVTDDTAGEDDDLKTDDDDPSSAPTE